MSYMFTAESLGRARRELATLRKLEVGNDPRKGKEVSATIGGAWRGRTIAARPYLSSTHPMSIRPPEHEDRPRAWSGKYPGSPSRFQLRHPSVPRDAIAVCDDDIDCVVGYQRVFGQIGYALDLLGQAARIWRLRGDEAPSDPNETRLVMGELWQPGVRARTRAGNWGYGALLGKDSRAALRRRFTELGSAPLLLAPRALEQMDQPDTFVPLHILRLAMLIGRKKVGAGELEFAALISVGDANAGGQVFQMLTVRTNHAGTVIRDFDTKPVPSWMVDG